MNVSSIILMFLVILIAIILSLKPVEKFLEKKALVDNQNNVANSMEYNKELFHQLILTMQRGGTIDTSVLDINKSEVELYVDPYVSKYMLRKDSMREYKDGIFLCLTPRKLHSSDCIWNMHNKVIAYSYISDYLFLQAMIKAYRQDVNKIKMIKISNDDLLKGDKTFDMFITYAVLDSEYLKFLEKSLYYINGFIDVDINRIKAFYPFVKENYKNMREYFNDDIMKEYVNGSNNVLIPIMKYKIVDLNNYETFITRLNMPEDYLDAQSYDEEKNRINVVVHSCYGNKNINNKYECDSAYNYDGTPKTYHSKWDSTCKAHEDCPYYRANKNYPNEYGGCTQGFCEIPVGIKRIGFTQYEATGINAPLCYECEDTLDMDCCNRQKNPDYVFAGDYDDRVMYNMKTVIGLLDIERY